jgi:hypothetical protein
VLCTQKRERRPHRIRFASKKAQDRDLESQDLDFCRHSEINDNIKC